MINTALAMLKKEYRMKSVDTGVYGKLVIQGMNFTIECYDAVGLGRVSVLRARGMFNWIRRDILVISPLEREVPLITFERDKTFAKGRFAWTENDFSNPVKVECYEGKNKELEEADASLESRVKAYIAKAKTAVACDEVARRDPIFDYVDEIIDKTALSSKFFLANYGLDHTIKVYHNLLFGTK